ncbi:sel1 repeat family protein [Candidatus Protochlamydia phocaeensis]|uniref:sel1 repeat family protein n=1 Tax=Candidatus Protochlamydia phocaeensis TaxID=1414722 RepID=UPI0008380165|nr:sel1 repeat family protein [Candidatus Protochlamydia phocaeensis]
MIKSIYFAFGLSSTLICNLAMSEEMANSKSLMNHSEKSTQELTPSLDEKKEADWIALFEEKMGDRKAQRKLIMQLADSNSSPSFVYRIADHFGDLDMEKAINDPQWLDKKTLAAGLCLIAAKQDYKPAISKLCDLCHNLGLSDKEAIYWEKKGCELGLSNCMVFYGVRLAAGESFDGMTKQDLVEGIKWILIASDMNDPAANAMKQALDSMPQAILDQAKQKAKDWKEKHSDLFS